jgi:hypothetical protein
VTDAQFALLLSALAAVGATLAGVLRWAVTRITKAIDDNTESNKDLSRAQIAYASSIGSMGAQLSHIANWVHAHTPPPVGRDVTPVDLPRAPSEGNDSDYTAPKPASRRRLRTVPLGHRVPTPKPGRGSDDE